MGGMLVVKFNTSVDVSVELGTAEAGVGLKVNVRNR
jgi:hypothetical protein